VGRAPRRAYRKAAQRLAFRALTRDALAAELLYVFQVARPGEPVTGVYHVLGSWLVADPAGNVTAHRGHATGRVGPWELAEAIVPGSAPAVRPPLLTGYYRHRPAAYRQLVADYEVARQRLQERHGAAVRSGSLYATLHLHGDAAFAALLRAAVADRQAQALLHDWLAERSFPHADELLGKKWNGGRFTEAQLLDLLTKPFGTSRRSFAGRRKA
jgi:hypothetical protein